MKKNFAIIILSIIVVFLIYKVMMPPVVTERRINLQNRYSNLSKDINKEQVAQNTKDQYDYRTDNDADEENDEFTDNFEQYRHNPEHSDRDFNRMNHKNFGRDNSPIRFKKGVKQNPDDENIVSLNIQTEQKSETSKNDTKKPGVFEQSIKTCKPYTEEMSSVYMGINIDYKIEILGWINDKCTIKFTSKMTGIDSSFTEVYGIDPSDAVIASFVPNIRCEFTKMQLMYVGDSILQEKERNNGATNNMLKNPNNINFPEFENMSADDLKLLQVVFGNKACKILNLDELKDMFNKLLDF